ncbi:TrbC/VirB2 family protein [Noviherbaspirillum pedocola]|uniref:TrbC/VirB2 family protein n=1 Tax=Noviherbaspirillum pedocola TaxID=2801341 RepID=A0A934SUQ5_9BURK|nr:TrbC/VirB2 family protein [Noviherbaspirillum pedocola]MBK4736072.1 TrbC/VirB2 family protein [Noviherbaspirillum pedocola]
MERIENPQQNPWYAKYALLALVVMTAMMPELAFAQTGGNGTNMFCYLAKYFHDIVGAAVLLVIMMWGIEHIFGVAKLHDMVIKVGVVCGIIVLAVTIITQSGLTVTCTGM